MKQCVVACQTLGDELEYVLDCLESKPDVIWIESGLHNMPKKLHLRLQETLAGLNGYDCVFLLFGLCGNAVLGLTAGNFRMIIPKVDDCISLLIGSQAQRDKIGREKAAYFLTDGWLRGERNIWVEYQYSIQKYGKEMADDIAKTMYGHYKALVLLDTQAAPIGQLVEKTKIISETFGLEQIIQPATTQYIKELFSGAWPAEKFVIIQPHGTVCETDFLL